MFRYESGVLSVSIRMEQLHRVIENRDLGNPDTIIIHVGTNDLRRTGNLDYVNYFWNFFNQLAARPVIRVKLRASNLRNLL